MGLRRLLAAEGDAAKREELSKSQTHVLKALVSKMDCTDPKFKTFAKDFVEKICDMASLMRQADQDELVLCIADLAATRKCSTWVMQNYSSVFSFWTGAKWKPFMESQSPIVCMRQAFGKAVTLGCRKPSEPTTRWWTSVVLANTSGLLAVEQLSTAALSEAHRKTKDEWRSCVGKLGKDDLPAGRKLATLPSDAGEFEARCPEWFAELFPTDKSVTCMTNLDDAVRIHQLYSCRGGSAKCVYKSAPVAPLFGPASDATGGGQAAAALVHIARAVAGGMHAIQASQAQMVETMTERALGDSGRQSGGSVARSDSGLSSRSGSGMRALEDEKSTALANSPASSLHGARDGQDRAPPSPHDESHENSLGGFGGVLGMLDSKK